MEEATRKQCELNAERRFAEVLERAERVTFQTEQVAVLKQALAVATTALDNAGQFTWKHCSDCYPNRLLCRAILRKVDEIVASKADEDGTRAALVGDLMTTLQYAVAALGRDAGPDAYLAIAEAQARIETAAKGRFDEENRAAMLRHVSDALQPPYNTAHMAQCLQNAWNVLAKEAAKGVTLDAERNEALQSPRALPPGWYGQKPGEYVQDVLWRMGPQNVKIVGVHVPDAQPAPSETPSKEPLRLVLLGEAEYAAEALGEQLTGECKHTLYGMQQLLKDAPADASISDSLRQQIAEMAGGAFTTLVRHEDGYTEEASRRIWQMIRKLRSTP